MAGIQRLYQIRNRFDSSANDEKLSLLRALRGSTVRSAGELIQLHTALCFIRAFPDTAAHYRIAAAELNAFEQRVKQLNTTAMARLADSGIAGTPLHYGFSYEVASWLARCAPGSICIDWEDTHDPPGLDEILTHLVHPAEDEHFDSGLVSSREWIEQASSGLAGTDFDWLLAQLRQTHLKPIWSQLYNAADLWLTWNLAGSRFSTSRNAYRVASIQPRATGMRRVTGSVKQEIMRPVETVEQLNRRSGQRMIDVAMASLAVRHRETYHFNHANPNEVYMADVGRGVSVVLFGLLPQHRYPLECTMGYLILGNGVPIGYGGSSVIFRQVNTGVNIFDEYRGSEAAFLWVQVMRVYHELAGSDRFIANSYQFGADNTEALKSGAFWFYYRLGYRPVRQDIRVLARQEARRIRSDRHYRSDLQTLRRLADCDMHLTLPGARASDYFDERWLTTSSALASRVLAEAGGSTRRDAADRVALQLASDVGIRNLDAWSASERDGFNRIAPIVAATTPRRWPADAKRSLRALLRAKGGTFEASYARLLSSHGVFLAELRKACHSAEKSDT